ncbi:hypothetical protein AAur_pTC10231 (plasmid) [Paenarthrobacter aurescens TC1]|uniref:Uncharacterized protein n=2 Tax=Paenarthrobacter aurescens TaxID=43663 RepID=Q6SKE2_PAEAU|nr:hypothetical protein [Paenarthrobacter aurescens]ABM10436.1 hypothetical protein AAur_pTC10231 [Paenarthrobacter aurescens TC1]
MPRLLPGRVFRGLLIGDGVACPVPLCDAAGHVDSGVSAVGEDPCGLAAAFPWPAQQVERCVGKVSKPGRQFLEWDVQAAGPWRALPGSGRPPLLRGATPWRVRLA